MHPPDAELDTTWFDDEGDLTELDSSDESDQEAPPPAVPRPETNALPAISPPLKRTKETRATTQRATEKSRVRGGLKNTVPCLKPPRTTNYSASSLFDWIQDKLVDLNPEYQRGVVWTEAKQTALIGSLFCNYYVPPIVFTVKRQDDGTEKRVCIDGKQRLTSIYRFMKGEIANKDAVTNRKSYFTNQPGSRKKLISDPLRGVFKNKQITCVEYEDLTGEQEREIFQRVQLGVSLAPADRLPAINGPYADLVRELRRQIESTQGFELYFEWGSARGKDFQALAQVVYLIKFGQQSKNTEPTTTRLEKFLGEQVADAGLKTLKETASDVMAIYCRIARNKQLGAPIRKNLMPLEFVMVCFLICVHRKRLTDTQLSDAMSRMRATFARGDRKTNTKNFKTLMTFVLKEVPKLIPNLRHGPDNEMTAVDKSTEDREQCLNNMGMQQQGSTSNIAVPAKARRAKRKVGESDSEDDIVPTKKKVRQKVEATRTPPQDDSSSTAAKTPKAEAPRSRLPPSSRAGTAKTTVKSASTRKASSTAAALAEKRKLESQVARPSVRPATSARTASGSLSASTSAVAGRKSSASTSAIAHEGQHLPAPVPLPTRTHTVNSSMHSITSGPVASTSALYIQPASVTHQEVSSTPRRPPPASPTDRPPSSAARTGAGSASTGGPPPSTNGGAVSDRLAPLRHAKAAAAQHGLGQVQGRSEGMAVGSSRGGRVASASLAQPGGTADPGHARRASPPNFTRQPQPQSRVQRALAGPVEAEVGWMEGLGSLLDLVSQQSGAVTGGMPMQAPVEHMQHMQELPPRALPPMAASGGVPMMGVLPGLGHAVQCPAGLQDQLQKLRISIPPGVAAGPSSAGPRGSAPRNAGSALATPTPSPNTPQYVTNMGSSGAGGRFDEPATRDPRKAKRQREQEAEAAQEKTQERLARVQLQWQAQQQQQQPHTLQQQQRGQMQRRQQQLQPPDQQQHPVLHQPPTPSPSLSPHERMHS